MDCMTCGKPMPSAPGKTKDGRRPYWEKRKTYREQPQPSAGKSGALGPISIHAPARARQGQVDSSVDVHIVSIHAPALGDTPIC